MKQRLVITLSAIAIALSINAQVAMPTLPYSYSALEPYFDSTTMYIHVNNHHTAYAKNYNKTLEKFPELYIKSIPEMLGNIDQLPSEIRTSVRNNGGGYWNHVFFWSILAPANTTSISPKLEKKLIENFGSVEKFKAEFEKAAATRFGSGWAWLIKEDNGKLRIISTANQDNMYTQGSAIKGEPLLTIDVWEHAYYLKYQSKRAEYIKAFWNVVNWKEVERLSCK